MIAGKNFDFYHQKLRNHLVLHNVFRFIKISCRAFLACKLRYNICVKFFTFAIVLWQIFNHWFNFWREIFIFISGFLTSFFSLKILIFLCVEEFPKNVLPFFFKQDVTYSHHSLADEEVFILIFSDERKPFVAEQKLGLHKRELLKYHECFPILFFEGNLSIETAL